MLSRRVGSAAIHRVIQVRAFAQKAEETAAATTTKTKLTEPRAVSKEEAGKIAGAATSSEESMMPWKGWFDAYLKERLSEERYKSLKATFYFKPDDPFNLQQIPNPSTKVPIGNDGEEAAFREVSPGSQPPVDVPKYDLDDDPYDSGYFKRDTRRRYEDPEFPHPDVEAFKLGMLDGDDPEVQEAKEKLAAGPKSSKGNKGVFPTGPSDFDPSGLRANMSVTPAALSKSLDSYMPNHLPEPTWHKEQEKTLAWYEENDLPVPIGQNTNFIRRERRVARW
eukprot:CAMPEP_0119563366 /NCGR_PEP_ID=MMETSP1352-20130426/23178_1 /TAXON_ID=265584 /ORGANISM="Stauroneis constricta, Strain CCMP1120" /LENGTH=278 /DNA_ID=CAMNT_0007611947 /DNA_START=79 /DNA_END=915 /DNA_ORIENTATION=+